jgi:MFS family permease
MLTYATLAFFTGYLVDRFGAKIVLLIGACLAAISCMISGWASSLVQVTLSYGIIFGAATCFLSQIPVLSLLVKLPSGVNSLSVGLVGSGPGIGSLLLAPSIGAVISNTGWRSAMRVIVWLFLGYLFLTLLLLRKKEYKNIPEGLKGKAGLGKIFSQGRNLPLLFSSFLLMATAIYGVLSQEAAYAMDRGMTLTQAGWALGLIPGIGVIASPLLGWLSDQVHSQKNLGALILAIAVVGIFFISVAQSWLVLALGSIVVGTAYASYAPIYSSLTRSLFGPDFFGRAWGFMAMGGSIGAALGSWLGGYLYDLQGNYRLVWLMMAISFWAASITLFLLDTANPGKKGTRFSPGLHS